MGVPLDLLVLGSLRYLGRGWTFDDLEESTGISEEVHRVFFHHFVKGIRMHWFPKYVKEPVTDEEIADAMKEFKEAGFDGCIGSADATHVVMEKCSAKLKNQHLGGKLSQTARAYEITVNHRRRILSTTVGFPGRWNDKTVVRFDGFINRIHRGITYNNVQYELHKQNGDKQKITGAWILVDGGYLKWSCTIPPYKQYKSHAEQRWSKWAESMRKDVECTFGILKGRFRILKTGIRLQSFEAVDNVWFTCCTLHNFLLEVDGLHAQWNNGVPSDFEGEMGHHHIEDVIDYLEPEILRRINNPTRYDSTLPVLHVVHEPNELVTERMRISYETMRAKLVCHFHYRFLNKDIKWPSRSGIMSKEIRGIA